MLRRAPFDKIGVTPIPDFVNADPANGIAGSIVNGLVFNDLQHEGENVELLAGLTPSGTDFTQWGQSISRGGIWVGSLTGTGDLAVATLGAVLPALLQGMRIGGVAIAANTVTNPKLRVVNIASQGAQVDFPILKEDGSALAVGDIVAGRRYRYEADGAGNVLISGGGIGSGSSTATNVYNLLDAAPSHSLRVASATNTMPSTSGVNNKITAYGTATNGISDRIAFNAGLGRFTCLKAGVYDVDLFLDTNMPRANYGQSLAVGVNGSILSAFAQNPISATYALFGPCFAVSGYVVLAVNDYFEVFAGHNYGSDQNMPVKVRVAPRGV